jgi:hypothetical protein
MERTLLTFTVPNIITVVLMGAIGYALFAVIAQVLIRYWGGGSSASNLSGNVVSLFGGSAGTANATASAGLAA